MVGAKPSTFYMAFPYQISITLNLRTAFEEYCLGKVFFLQLLLSTAYSPLVGLRFLFRKRSWPIISYIQSLLKRIALTVMVGMNSSNMKVIGVPKTPLYIENK